MATNPDNFLWSGVHSGVKNSRKLDLGLVYSSYPSTVAGVFTGNNLPAAPVREARARLNDCEQFRGLVVNSGVANAAMGQVGIEDNQEVISAAADCLNLEKEEILTASTGYIGRRLPVENIREHIPAAVDNLKKSPDEFSRGILTTDTRRKVVREPVEELGATMMGVAKGSGMINPRMATMLAFIFFDHPVEPGWWRAQLPDACDNSFNLITVDGDTSTNDTVLAWAAGLPGKEEIDGSHSAAPAVSGALQRVCEQLAYEIVRDGEGATCTVEVLVEGAKNDAAAARVAEEVAGSPLVRTAFYGRDPNWGRIYSAVGAAGVSLQADKLNLQLNGTDVFDGGEPVETDPGLKSDMKEIDQHTVTVDLGLDNGSARRVTCDLSEDYVTINSNYG